MNSKALYLKKYGKQFTAILLGEGIAAALLVGITSTLNIYFVCHSWTTALAAGVVFGAIASATDPASTINVLWEYRSAGVLTTSIIAIVALDDALAMTLYGLGSSIASILTQSNGISIGAALLHTAFTLFGAIAVEAMFGFALNVMMRCMPQTERRLGISVGIILLCIGVAVAFDLDVILSTMTVGIVLINLAPRRSKKLFEVVRSFSTPIYIVFFVLVGARLSLKGMPPWIWALVFTYVVMRSLGKWAGRLLGWNHLQSRHLAVAARAIMQPVKEQVTEGMNLEEAIQALRNIQVDAVPVVDNLESNRLKGVLDIRRAQHKVRAEMMRRKTDFLKNNFSTCQITGQSAILPTHHKKFAPIVYRLGPKVFILVSGVRLSVGAPFSKSCKLTCSFFVPRNAQNRRYPVNYTRQNRTSKSGG